MGHGPAGRARRPRARSLALAAALLWLAACDEDVAVPAMTEPAEAPPPAPAPSGTAATLTPSEGGPRARFASACVPEATVPAALAAPLPFDSCHRAVRPGVGVRPPGMPPGGSARFDAARTVEARRRGEVLACCYTWPIRPPGAPLGPLPSPSTPPAAGVGAARPAVAAPPPVRRRPNGQGGLPLGLRGGSVGASILGQLQRRMQDAGAASPNRTPPRRGPPSPAPPGRRPR